MPLSNTDGDSMTYFFSPIAADGEFSLANQYSNNTKHTRPSFVSLTPKFEVLGVRVRVHEVSKHALTLQTSGHVSLGDDKYGASEDSERA